MEEKDRLKIDESELAKKNNQEKGKDIPIEPFKTNCDYCGRNVVTCVKKEYNLTLFPFAIIIFYIFGFYFGSIILATTFLLFQNISHICPECLCEITYKSFYPIKQQGSYYSLTFAKCTIVIKKLYIHIIILLVILLGVYLNVIYYTQGKYKKNNINSEIYKRNDEKYIKNFYDDSNELTWETLIKECGAKVMIENSARAIEIFNKKYFKKNIQWKGYFISAFVNRLSQMGMGEPGHLVNLNIRMIPSETIKAQDLILSMGRENFMKHFEILKKMKTGTPVEFMAEFESIGDEWRPHHLHLFWIKIIDDFMTDKINITLFRGVKFDIQGHLQLKNQIETMTTQTNNTNSTINYTINSTINSTNNTINNTIN
jgi:hypothetical protein